MSREFDEAGVINSGEPLPNYTRGEDHWPRIWRDFEIPDDAEFFSKVAALTDDVVLREAVHCWDNCLRLPESKEGILAGVLGALVRLAIGFNPDPAAFDEFADGVAESMRKMAQIAREQMMDEPDVE